MLDLKAPCPPPASGLFLYSDLKHFPRPDAIDSRRLVHEPVPFVRVRPAIIRHLAGVVVLSGACVPSQGVTESVQASWTGLRSPLPRCGCQRRSGLLVEVRSPLVHQLAPTLEQVRPEVDRLDPVLHHVRQHHLNHLLWMIRLLRRPVPKGRPEAFWHGQDLVVLEQQAQPLFGKRLAAPLRDTSVLLPY